IIGSRGLGGIREFVLGSVSHNVVQHAVVPVLVIK
ncbi:MAG: UspA domain protein, partial [Paenibacillaceae bacterium]|nr:UspA domain protein [Paenibacillaceae bacterium]